MANLGALVVSLEANMAQFTSDMGRAAQQTEQAMGKINQAVNLAKAGIAALGLLEIGKKMVGDVRGVIEYADHLNDLSKACGLAIETLDGLALAAKQSGGDLDSAADSISKLSVNIGKAPEKYRALGISAKEPIEAFKQLADIYNKIDDPQKRAAFAAEALGKSWKGAAPLLAEGSKGIAEMIEKGHTLSGVTKETAEMADKFNDAMAEMETAQRSLARELAKDLLPGLTVITQAMADGYREGGKLHAVMMGMDRLGAVLYSDEYQNDAVKLENLTKKLDELYASKQRIAAMPEVGQKIAGFLVDPRDRSAEIAQAEQDMLLLKAKMAAARAPPGPPTPKDKPTEAKVNAFLGGNADAKALLDGRLKMIENAYASERDAIAFHAQYMQEERNQDLISLDAYNAGKVKTINDGLAVALKAYDGEIAVLKKARTAAVEKPERAQIDNQIEERRNAKAKARTEASQALSLNTLSLSASQSDLNKTMKEWNIQQDLANAQLEFSNSLYGKSTLEVTQLTEARRIELDVEEKIRLAKEKGAITEASIERFRADAKAKSDAAGKFLKGGAVQQAVDGLRKPAEIEQQNHESIMKILLAGKDDELQVIAGGNEAIERENMRHQIAMAEIRAQEDLQTLALAGNASDQLYSLLANAGMEQTALGKTLFLANKAIAVAEIILNSEVAATKALTMGPIIGPPLSFAIRAMGYASAGIVVGTTIASAEGGYDIPSGVNPVTQLHEKEMVLPRAQADVIRGLAGGSGGVTKYTIVNNTSAPIGRVTEVQISPTERALIIEEAAAKGVHMTAAHMGDPNSNTSRSMNRNFNVQRTRG